MSAESVWKCIVIYRNATSEEISKSYWHKGALIVTTLAKYANKSAYHGHTSGKPGDATSSAADANLDKAITFLRNNVPAQQPMSTKNTGDKSKKGASQQSTATLIDIVNSEDNLGNLVRKLDTKDSKWRKNRLVWNSYATKYRVKKGKEPPK